MSRLVSAILTVRVPDWMNNRQAFREIKTLVNEQGNYLSMCPLGEEVIVRATSVKGAVKTKGKAQ